jgi:hypothetical protein
LVVISCFPWKNFYRSPSLHQEHQNQNEPVAQEVAEGDLCEADEVVLEVLQEEEVASALVEEVAEGSQEVAAVASLQEEEEVREVDLLVDVVDTLPPMHLFRCHGVFGFLCRVYNCHWRLLGFNQKAHISDMSGNASHGDSLS